MPQRFSKPQKRFDVCISHSQQQLVCSKQQVNFPQPQSQSLSPCVHKRSYVKNAHAQERGPGQVFIQDLINRDLCCIEGLHFLFLSLYIPNSYHFPFSYIVHSKICYLLACDQSYKWAAVFSQQFHTLYMYMGLNCVSDTSTQHAAVASLPLAHLWLNIGERKCVKKAKTGYCH